jgi:hypothetical protein
MKFVACGGKNFWERFGTQNVGRSQLNEESNQKEKETVDQRWKMPMSREEFEKALEYVEEAIESFGGRRSASADGRA